MKIVMVLHNDIEALIDTGSDLTLMYKDEYERIGSPPLRPTEVRFTGVGSPAHTALGEFQTEVTIDGHRFPILIRVAADAIFRQRLLIGTDFLELRNFHAKKGTIYIDPDDETEDLPEMLQINVLDEENAAKVDLSHTRDEDAKRQIATWIEDYRPDKTAETTVSMRLVLKDNEAVYQKARRLAANERDIVNAQIEEWKSQGIVRPSSSDYASPVVLFKKRDGTHRLCVDYRLLNKKIVRDRYPLPLIEDQLDRLQDTKIFSTLDLKNGFFHMPVEAESVKYTAFIVPDGQFEFLRVPFGLCNSPSVFQRYVNAIFRDAIRDGTVLTYMDDLIVLSNNYEDGLDRLRMVFETASKAGLNINWKKCCFLKRRVEFLGHIIEDGTVRPSERKTEAVKRFAEPKNIRQVQAFLGLTGYFGKFIADYSRIARPLSNLLRADAKFNFDAVEREAFELLKMHLSQQPVLNLYQMGAETELHTDASKYGYGAILLQRNGDDGLLHPVYFASGKTTSAEERYSSYELEVLAIIRALRRFRVYLLGIHFKIVTDCKAFTMTIGKKDLCVRLARWALLLVEFQYSIEHRPGRSMKHVDALSRNPLPACLTIDESEEGLTARLRKAQRDDDELKKKIEQAKEGKLDGYTMQRGLLYKVNDETRVVVPRSMQLQIIRKAHERGHFAINKTETLIQNDYWIPELRLKTEKVIRNCIPCILAERQQGKQQGFLNPIEKGSVPLDTFHVDYLGPLPSTKKSYAHILVVVDAFAKFVWLYGTKFTTSAEVISRLRKQSFILGLLVGISSTTPRAGLES
ncbi:blastopia polyprotein [Lasius niger]|uniref:RNA-directed DNA polymerase n=1 Tax=Lasius niger TaxID=67767 RepID=A0A0J7KVJ0_LASNI|nr:blastopia polyprotein [Lasius niger]